MEHGAVERILRSPDRTRYPELAGYTRDEIYEDCLGGGALYLAARLVRTMDLGPGDLVLDLGCGKGTTSIFMAREFGVQVVALDLWTSATFLANKFAARGLRHRIVPLNMDVTGRLPFAEGYFDAIFCMNSLSFYGGSVAFLQHLLVHLRPGGLFAVGMETMTGEFTPEQRQDPPAVYSYNLPPPLEQVSVWEADFSKMHSPPWWARLFGECGLLHVLDCQELDDAVILYEDLVRYQIEHNLDTHDVHWSLAQLAWGDHHRPGKTLFTITARKL